MRDSDAGWRRLRHALAALLVGPLSFSSNARIRKMIDQRWISARGSRRTFAERGARMNSRSTLPLPVPRPLRWTGAGRCATSRHPGCTAMGGSILRQDRASWTGAWMISRCGRGSTQIARFNFRCMLPRFESFRRWDQSRGRRATLQAQQGTGWGARRKRGANSKADLSAYIF